MKPLIDREGTLAAAFMASPPSKAGIAVALGAGGARGIAHVVVLEALDELGLRPTMIVGHLHGRHHRGSLCGGHFRQRIAPAPVPDPAAGANMSWRGCSRRVSAALPIC